MNHEEIANVRANRLNNPDIVTSEEMSQAEDDHRAWLWSQRKHPFDYMGSIDADFDIASIEREQEGR